MKYFWIIMVFSFFISIGRAYSEPSGMEVFKISDEPLKGDWLYFNGLSEAEREALWSYHGSLGDTLGDWAWQWRIGWIRSCTYSNRDYCRRILKDGLMDKAVVVRAEAVRRLGDRFEGSGNRQIIELLSRTYGNEKNIRNGKPLFIQFQILAAIYQIGGQTFSDFGRELAQGHAETSGYWTLLTKNQKK
ncbi:MAG: hypothetical protein HQK54_02025 [Oligoflexales bacterium]|nr:hypothetical protein [Oligoflexales bacterium]